MLYGANLLAVRVFGELEFWFALIKVVTIVGFIVAGLGVIFFHVGELGAHRRLLQPLRRTAASCRVASWRCC